MKKLITLLSVWTLVTVAAFADLPFRNHRYDAFRVLPVTSNDIVFIGNSITNMHEWWEAFGCNHNIKNRGVSGAVTDETIANIEAIIAGKPRKAFIMIGTNDLGTQGINTAERVAGNVEQIIERFQKESPSTTLYIQSILPSALRDRALQAAANTLLKGLCEKHSITYIDLWDDLADIATCANGTSLDYLHLSAAGYKIWCDKIAPLVLDDETATSVYPANTASLQNNAGLGGSYGMRANQFSMLPVNDGDIIVIGDEMIHGGEWHELLQSGKVKSRGTGWGYPGPSLSQVSNHINVIFNSYGTNNPASVFLYAGASDANNGTVAATMLTNYKAIVNAIRAKAPDTKIFMMSLLPTSNASTNSNYVVPFNSLLSSYAAESTDDNIEFVDIYTDLASGGVGSSTYFNGNYLYGKGYVKVAQKMAAAIADETIVAITDEEAEATYTRFTNRTALGTAISTAASLPEGDGVGEYTAENLATLRSKVDAAYALLTSESATTEEINSMGTEIAAIVSATLESINMPTASTDDNEIWYQLYTPNRDNRYLSSQGVGNNLVGNTANANASSMWKFTERADGSLNIINRADASYINPSAAYNTAVSTSATEPSAGWTLSYSNTPGCFIISSGTVQLNQTQSGLSYKIYNWSSGQTGTDRDDTGCQYKITPAPEPEIIELEENQLETTSELTEGWYQIKVGSGSDATMQGYVDNGTNQIIACEDEYRQTASNYYPYRITAYDEDKPAKSFIYITPSGNGYYTRGIGGHYVNENCTASRTIPGVTAISISEGRAIIGKWSYYNPGGAAEEPYVGKMSSKSDTYKIYRLPDETLALYDIYTVTMTDVANVGEIGNDVRVTCTHADNKGIASVYAGGKFFFPAGTKISPSDFSAPPSGNLHTLITIDGSTINLEYTVESAIENIAPQEKNSPIYDITGRRTDTISTQGIYIIDGKKRIIL